MSAIEDRVADVFDAAMAYVSARLANEAAEPRDITSSVVRVDGAWARLLDVSGLVGSEGQV